SSTDGNKSFVRVRVSDIDPAVHSQLQLTVCTVSAEENAPHPYYLHGDHCSNGYFQLKKPVDALDGKAVWDICFDRLSVICVPKKNKASMEKAMEARLRDVPTPSDCPTGPSAKYTQTNLAQIRLAFSLTYCDIFYREWLLSTVFSDKIVSDKEKKNIDVIALNPAEAPMDGGCTIAIHTKASTAGIQKGQVKVHFSCFNDIKRERVVLVSDVHELRKESGVL
uniref:RHD domain-containing protein n=1 Tax=Macrostomum lignano TaxID=282301 RepID=A0A1I8HPJ5_9PLAT